MSSPRRTGSIWRIMALLGLMMGLPALTQEAQPANRKAASPHRPASPYAQVHAEAARRSTADHGQYKILKGPFKEGDGSAVTKACLTCHPKAAEQVMGSSHWTWNPKDKRLAGYGKSTHLVNNFCISAQGGNQAACARCHAGYGMTDRHFDFSKSENIDCLVCHDTTGDYEKIAGGFPNPAVPLDEIAQKVGRSTLQNCGVCHFFGGGADATKHGDLDDTILKATPAVDVHMSKQGAAMVCTDCHVSHAHEVSGPNYVIPADKREKAHFPGESMSRMACSACHTDSPHASTVLNRHYRKVACQTCHIPDYARGGLASNLSWDWSTAGKLKNGRPYKEEDANGFETYNTIHGDMVWAKNVKPSYIWYNGNLKFTLLTDTLPAQRPVMLNPAEGSYIDSAAKIWPFKIHEGKQPFDPVLNRLVAPYTAGPKGSGAFWGDYDWDTAIKTGMEKAGLPYSGKHDFVSTTMLWPITHMVAPAKDALSCKDCHDRNGRLEGVEGFYLPGRDRGWGVDFLGWTLVALVAAATLTHGILRYLFAGRS